MEGTFLIVSAISFGIGYYLCRFMITSVINGIDQDISTHQDKWERLRELV